jgi:RecB family exonuclease
MKRYGTARRFRGLDGLQHTYEDHMWIDRGNRIHMIREETHRDVEVGYIGVHLPTMDYPT